MSKLSQTYPFISSLCSQKICSPKVYQVREEDWALSKQGAAKKDDLVGGQQEGDSLQDSTRLVSDEARKEESNSGDLESPQKNNQSEGQVALL
jgi:hypothetical protein